METGGDKAGQLVYLGNEVGVIDRKRFTNFDARREQSGGLFERAEIVAVAGEQETAFARFGIFGQAAQVGDAGFEILNFERMDVGPFRKQFDTEENKAKGGGE